MKKIVWFMLPAVLLLHAASSKVDDKSGLIWQDDSSVGSQSFTYDEALSYCKNLRTDGHEDWRVPTLKELYTIVDLKVKRPALKRGFAVRDDGKYWSATPFAKDPKREAWYLSFSYGESEPYSKTRLYHVRCVRK